MEAAGNSIADLDPRDTRADRCDLAGAIGKRYHAELGRTTTAALQDHQIAVIERARAYLQQDLLRPGLRILARSQHDAVNAAKAVDAVGFHFSPRCRKIAIATWFATPCVDANLSVGTGHKAGLGFVPRSGRRAE